MNSQTKNDRRKYYRMHFRNQRSGRVEFIRPSSSPVQARLLDVGGGGLRCAVSRNTKDTPEIESYFDRIHVFSSVFANPLIFSGIIRRSRPLSGRQGIELGVEFSAVLTKLHQFVKDEDIVHEHQSTRSSINKNLFLARLQQSQPYSKVRDVKKREQRRLDLHNNFQDIAYGLPPEERWWFYCVIDSLKNTGQRYQKGLLVEYLDLCHKGTDNPLAI
ncbi:MAG: hypothetical protein DWQ10_18565 [Calditrichaeota bacterium]|nr:MAG: hypothetical protein DWQ10_18565 [Calditrichota bacterium]